MFNIWNIRLLCSWYIMSTITCDTFLMVNIMRNNKHFTIYTDCINYKLEASISMSRLFGYRRFEGYQNIRFFLSRYSQKKKKKIVKNEKNVLTSNVVYWLLFTPSTKLKMLFQTSFDKYWDFWPTYRFVIFKFQSDVGERSDIIK